MSLSDLPKQYDPHDAQRRWYAFWLEKGYFHAPDDPANPYCIVIPPPNVTGALHLGHALNNTIQDILIRWRRMQGYDALWMPGTDHAGIATQAVVEKRLREEEGKTRHDIGREDLVRRIWTWKDEYEARILSQLKQMGCSCDWDRTRFTLDEIGSRAVRATFFRLFAADKIYRGKRLVNWDTHLRTAVADDEIENQQSAGHLWTIRYPLTGTSDFLVVATTRPETMLGDTAVAVHPSDPRYQHLIGKTVTHPLIDRPPIPIIADAILVNPEFGTGCVKVTPAHDPNDYATGLRHNLEMINLLNPDGTYNENAGKYAGLFIKEVRKRVVADLDALGLLVKVEPHTLTIPLSDRSKTPIEPYLSDQWFVRMGDGSEGEPGFATKAMEAVTSGAVRITPERYAKSYLDWLGEKRDWCVSRQLWWGHRIPVWRALIDLGDEGAAKLASLREMELRAATEDRDDIAIELKRRTGELINTSFAVVSGQFRDRFGESAHVQPRLSEDGRSMELFVCVAPGHEEVERDLKEHYGAIQDEDVLDTWFSSALWPHSTLHWPDPNYGWPGPKPDRLDPKQNLAEYYPTSVLSTARDIITLWVARMVIFGQFNVGDVPFKDVFIHPVIQDGHGKRMSKTAGNGIDPVDIIDLYGADALRFTLALSATETQDLRMPVEKTRLPDGREVNTSERFEQGRTFPNKFWNAARFALINLEGYEPTLVNPSRLTNEDKWILDGLRSTAVQVTKDFESFRFAEATKSLRDFTWNDFCDWYLEFIKNRLRDPGQRHVAQSVLAWVLSGLCRLLHPIMPFVTEQVWQALRDVAPRRGIPEPSEAEESVCIARWPIGVDLYESTGVEARRTVDQWRDKITAIRNLRAERNIPPSAKVQPIIIATGPVAAMLKEGEAMIRSLANASSLEIVPSADRPSESASAILSDAELILPLAGLIDKKEEVAKLTKQRADLEKQLASIRAKLGNEGFISRAPAEVVDQQRVKESELSAQLASVIALLGR